MWGRRTCNAHAVGRTPGGDNRMSRPGDFAGTKRVAWMLPHGGLDFLTRCGDDGRKYTGVATGRYYCIPTDLTVLPTGTQLQTRQ
jgi:hypothetical protein